MISLRNVYKIYPNDIVALNAVDLEFSEGELIILKGVSGSGKSTILSLIAGLSKPTSGDVIVDAQNIAKLPDHFCSLYRQASIGFIFQKFNLISNLSVKDNILLPLIPLNLDEEELTLRLVDVMTLFNISHKENELVKNLSGGEQQRVAIARANVNRPKIILADEPTASLDEKLSLEFIEILKEMKSQNKTIIVATHDPLFFNLDFVDRVVNIEHSKILK